MRSKQIFPLSIKLRQLVALVCATLFWSPWSQAELIPADRRIEWTPGVMVGVPGGIPTNRTKLINVTAPPYNADGTGASNASNAIQAAINAAAPNDVIFLPAGTYRLESELRPKNNTTIRGAGMDVTTLKYFGSGSTGISARAYTSGFWDPSSLPVVTSGATKGSTVLTVSDTSSFTVGNMLQVARFSSTNQFEVPVVLHVQGNSGGFGYVYKQKAKLVAKTATTLTIFPPLYGNMTGQTVRVIPGRSDGGIGIEDLTMDLSALSASVGIFFEEQMGTWIKNVKVKHARGFAIHLMDCMFVEMRGCHVEGPANTGPNGAALIFTASGACLIEDNIFTNTFPLLEINAGSSGNVFAYNFCLNITPANGLFAIDANHGPHNSYNLYEGNVANNIISDGYFGSASHDTIFRNWLHRIDHWYTLSLKRFTRNYSVVGNVFGRPGGGLEGSNDGTYFGEPNMGNDGSSGQAPIWSDWGTPAGSGGFQERDLGVLLTLVRKGNFSYHSGAQESLGGDTLPNSLYLSAKPAWFGSLTWPPVNPAAPGTPDNNQIFAKIPAGFRYVNGANATPPPSTTPSSTTPTLPPAPTSTSTSAQNPTPTPATTPAPALTPAAVGDLIVAYGLNEGTGTTTGDASGNGNGGTINGAAWTTQGRSGGALVFHGNGGYLSSTNPIAYATQVVTVAGWYNFKKLNPGIGEILFSSSRIRGNTGTFSAFNVWGFVHADFWSGGGRRDVSFRSPPTDSWHHIAFIFDGTVAGGKITVYVDGALQPTTLSVNNGVGTAAIPTETLYLGWGGGISPFFNGMIDEFRIYRKELTQAEIQADMDSTVGGGVTANPTPSATPTPALQPAFQPGI